MDKFVNKWGETSPSKPTKPSNNKLWPGMRGGSIINNNIDQKNDNKSYYKKYLTYKNKYLKLKNK